MWPFLNFHTFSTKRINATKLAPKHFSNRHSFCLPVVWSLPFVQPLKLETIAPWIFQGGPDQRNPKANRVSTIL